MAHASNLDRPGSERLLRVEGCHLIPPALETSALIGCPGLVYASCPLPLFFFISRKLEGLPCRGAAQCLAEVIRSKGPTDQGPSSGVESVAINDVLFTSEWQAIAAWGWDRPMRINFYETESAVTAM